MRPLLLTLCLALAFPAAAQAPFVADLEARLAATTPVDGSRFGFTSDLDGDRAVVGGTDVANDLNYAYIYSREGSGWVQEFDTTLVNGQASSFGLAIDGDVAVIGDPAGGAEIKGVAYVYERQDGSWVQTAELSSPSLAFRPRFGYSVDVHDGRILVGAPDDGDVGVREGAVLVFQKTGGTWTQQARFTANDISFGDNFGFSVSLDGDRAVVGAVQDDDQGEDSGSAYVFELQDEQWTQTAKLRPGANTAGALFGYAVALQGDRVAVGARDETIPGVPGVGAVHTFRQEGGAWPLLERLTPTASVQYGYDVHLGADRLVIGSVGGADVFGRSSSGWTQEASPVHPDGPTGSDGTSRFFGFSVAVSGQRMIVGAPGEDIPPGTDQGAAYLFDLGVFVSDEAGPAASAVSLSAPSPNPTRDRAALTLTVAAPGRAVAVLHDALGRRVAVLLDREVSGSVRLDVPTADLAPGVYTVRVETAGGAAVRRLSVVR